MSPVTVRSHASLFAAAEERLRLLLLHHELDGGEPCPLVTPIAPRLLLALPTPTPKVLLSWIQRNG
jgi:hypothetical protein